MIDHIGIRVSDLPQSATFYPRALEPLGYQLVTEFHYGVGLGADGKPDFWLYPGEAPPDPVHVAFLAPSRDRVDAVYAAAMNAGATGVSAPSSRPEYHPAYYGAFVNDPDGYNFEVVCHRA